jgi:hypothetical protein
MLPRVVAATVVTQLSLASSGLAEPRTQTRPRQAMRDTPAPPGHRGLVVGAALAVGWMFSDRSEDSTERGGGAEAFLGWALGRVALVGWGKVHFEDDRTHKSLGGAVRVWPSSRARRLHAEARVGRGSVGPTEYECGEVDLCDGSPSYLTAGGAIGFELLTTRAFALDARASLDREIVAGREDFTLLGLGLAFHID